jgi:hypothetical protein
MRNERAGNTDCIQKSADFVANMQQNGESGVARVALRLRNCEKPPWRESRRPRRIGTFAITEFDLR